jgi:NHL repeat
LRALVLAAATVALLTPLPSGQDALPDLPNVSTLAGSGAAGIADGTATLARFEGPQGIAADRRGNVYVADTPAQRVRVVDSRGTVKTIAGSGSTALFGDAVPGGYRDGPAAQAQFNGPTGVALARDGAVYVADLENHCVRKIQDGAVSTFAGSPDRVGHLDGTLATASFTNPRSIAIGRDGSVFVSDYPTGVRRIDPSGIVSTMHGILFDGATSVATYDDGSSNELLVGTSNGIGVWDLTKGNDQPLVGFATSNRDDESWRRTGQTFVGPPSAIASLNANEFVYADTLFSTVHLVQIDRTHPWHGSRILGAQPLLSASGRGGGFRDGAGGDALYDQPSGIAVSASGSIIVADTGNKRIRQLSAFNRRSYTTDHAHLPDSPNPHAFRVAIVGHSIVWQDIGWRQSIAGRIQSRICAARTPSGARCNVEVYPVWVENAGPPAMVSYIKEYLSDGLVNVVVFVIPTPHRFTQGVPDENSFGASLEGLLKDLNARTKEGDTRLLAVMIPVADQLPNEDTFLKYNDGFIPLDPGLVQQRYSEALAAVKRSKAAYIDLWPSFYANDAMPQYRPLFRSFDPHLSDFGNQLAGDAIAKALVEKGFAKR